MSEFSNQPSEQYLAEGLSRIHVVYPEDRSDRVLLHFTDIPDGEAHDTEVLVNAEFFARLVFQLWNAGQPKSRELARLTDVPNRGVWLIQQNSNVNLQEQVFQLCEDFVELGDNRDPFAQRRVSFIQDIVKQRQDTTVSRAYLR